MGTHLHRILTKVLALILQVSDVLIVLLFDIHKTLEFILVPLQLLFEANNPHILGQLGVLLLRFLLQKLEFFLNLVHVGFECKPEVVLVLAKYID